MWPRIADWFGVKWTGLEKEPAPLEVQMEDCGPIWKTYATETGPRESVTWPSGMPSGLHTACAA
jgi:hypothetical protein